MIALQWQGQVLSLLDQSKYPQEESWITCTDVKAVAEVLSSGAVIEEKIAAVAGVYGYCLAALEHQALQQTPAFDEKLAEAKALQAYYEAELAAAKAKAFANIDEETDAVLAQLAEGADWDALMAEKTHDPGMQEGRDTAKTGYAVCENFSSFDAAFTAAAMALEKVGDVSPKTEGVYGYYIIQYTSDVQEGPVDLADVREELHDSLLTEKQNTTYDEALAQWVEAANAKINYDEMAK